MKALTLSSVSSGAKPLITKLLLSGQWWKVLKQCHYRRKEFYEARTPYPL
jgi:hypothetical protein